MIMQAKKIRLVSWMVVLGLTACNLPASTPLAVVAPTNTSAPLAATASDTPVIPSPTVLPPTETFTALPPTETFTALPPTETVTPSPPPFVENLKATVTAELLSCRYGPGPEYLYLYGLVKGARIVLIGRADGNNWVMVEGKNKCWLNAKYVEVQGDPKTLKIMYPSGYKLPTSPYYPPTRVLSATRSGNTVTVEWDDIPLRAGDEEDADMLHYIIEAWRCEGGQIIFDPLATNDLSITFVDEAGCGQPSHGRVYVQEKHGFAGPADIPWPAP